MLVLSGLKLNELENLMDEMHATKFRAKQIFKWFSRGVTNLDEMTDISAKTKEKLREKFNIATVDIWQRFDSKLDETKKYLMDRICS